MRAALLAAALAACAHGGEGARPADVVAARSNSGASASASEARGAGAVQAGSSGAAAVIATPAGAAFPGLAQPGAASPGAASPGTASPGTAQPGAAQESGEAERAVAAALDDLHDAAARADEARYFAHFASDGVFLGTDAGERWSIAAFRDYAHPYFAKGKAWSFRGVRRRIAVRGDVAWFEEDLETERLGAARGSGVLARREGRWLLEQYVLSLTIPNERAAAVRALLDQK